MLPNRLPISFSPRRATLLFMAALITASTAFATTNSFPPFAALPKQAALPDPLVMMDGTKVASQAKWNDQRRPELRRLFQHYVYGTLPPTPGVALAVLEREDHDFLDGQATLKIVTLSSELTNAPRIDLMVVIPNAPPPSGASNYPVFLALNFCGNHALTKDPRVPLARSWMGKGCPGCTNNVATEDARGSQATNWPLAEMVRRGYAFAAFYQGDVDPDQAEASTGIYAALANGNSAVNNPTNRGTIAAWAWGFRRCVDYLEMDPRLNPKRIAVVGHSRNGKAAMLAAAFDQRIAMAFPHQAGCGGTAPSRGKVGESVKAINSRFPHWFNAKFKEFNDEPDRLPIDQNCLVALCAPRPVLFSVAEDDQWSNPSGQFDVLLAADPVYRFLGSEGLATKQMPPLRTLISSPLGFYIREGKHSMTVGDWTVFMDFADKQWYESAKR